jgi:hypothetical protein
MWWLLFVGLVLTSSSCLLWVSSSSCLLYPRGRGYKEGNRVGYNTISIRTLSLLVYFTYIFIDIIIYALGAHHGPLESSRCGLSHRSPLLGPSESMRGGTLGTNSR